MADTDIPAQVNGTDAAAGAPEPEAPYGWTTDPKTGERRPRKRPGRRPAADRPPENRPPSLEELRGAGPVRDGDAADRAPGRPNRRAQRRSLMSRVKEPKPVEELPPFRAGPLAKGINRLYRKAGKILKTMDNDLGSAVIACTVKEDEDDTTVGEAWEELCRTNPRVRAFWLKWTEVGAVGTLVAAHAPILLALLLKDSIRRRIPFHKLIEAFMDDDDDGQDEEQEAGEPRAAAPAGAGFGGFGGFGRLMKDLTPEDMEQIQAVGDQMLAKMAGKVPRSAGTSAERAPVVDAPEDGP